MRIVLDTNVIVAAVRSPKGASAELLRRTLTNRLTVLCSVPLFFEYEAVLSRPEHLAAADVTLTDVNNLLCVLAQVVTPLEIAFLWRPQLRDAADDMVLEAAANGRANAIITFNQRDFQGYAQRFGINILTPAQFFTGEQ